MKEQDQRMPQERLFRSSQIKKDFSGAGFKLVQEGMTSSCLKKYGARARACPRRRDQLKPPPAKVRENLGGVRAGPRRWDQLGLPPSETHENWGGESKLVLNLGGVRAGPRRWDELGPPMTKFCWNSGGVRAGPRRWDELGPPPAKICETAWRGPSLSQGMG